jgi:serine/threonine-protein kinase
MTEKLAVQSIEDAGLQDNVVREAHEDVQAGLVFEQEPQPGDRIEKGNFVTIRVSTGKPKTTVPDVVGRSRDDAVAALVDADLKANVVGVNSNEPVDQVLAQGMKAGTEVVVGTTVRINVSKGPKPISVPNVVGSPFESAQSQLQGLNFAVAREDVESAEPAGVVVDQDPAAGTQQAKGSVITLQVSSGPATSQVPDVTSQTEAQARAQLQRAGFQVQVVEEIVADQNLDGKVLSQDPEGGTDAEEGTTVVIVVGRFEAAPPPPTEPTETDTAPIP